VLTNEKPEAQETASRNLKQGWRRGGVPTLRRRRQLGRPTKTSPHVHTCTASTRGGRWRGRRPPAAAGQGQACPNAGHAPRRPAGRPRSAAAPPWAARWRPTAGGGAGVRRPAATRAVAHDLTRRSGAVVTRPWQRLSPSWEGRLDTAVTAMARPAAGRGGSGPADPSRERVAARAGPPRRPPHRGRRRLRRPLGSGGCVSFGGRCTWRHKNGARAPPTRGSRQPPPPPRLPPLSPPPRPRPPPAAACGRASCTGSSRAHSRVRGSCGSNAASGGRCRPHAPRAGTGGTDAITKTAAHLVPTRPPVRKLKLAVSNRAPRARFWPTTAEKRHHGRSWPRPPALTTP